MWKIYYADISPLEDEALFQFYLKEVQQVRREKVLRLKRKEDKCRSLAVGVLLAHALEQEHISYKQIQFETGEHGKPAIRASHTTMEFNLSHAGNYAAVTIADVPVGVDVEDLRERLEQESGRRRMERMMEQVFTEEEKLFVRQKPIALQKDTFVYLWTRKECYAKAYGQGMYMDFSKILTLTDQHYYSMKLCDNCWLSAYARTDILEEPKVYVWDLKTKRG